MSSADAVHRHLVSDVPLGVFLSGGVDSAALVALASRAQPRLTTLTVVFDEREFSEGAEARQIAQQFQRASRSARHQPGFHARAAQRAARHGPAHQRRREYLLRVARRPPSRGLLWFFPASAATKFSAAINITTGWPATATPFAVFPRCRVLCATPCSPPPPATAACAAAKTGCAWRTSGRRRQRCRTVSGAARLLRACSGARPAGCR